MPFPSGAVGMPRVYSVSDTFFPTNLQFVVYALQEKPKTVKTHLRNMVIVPEMIGSVVGVYNGKTFNVVEVRVSLHCVPCRLVFQHCRPP